MSTDYDVDEDPFAPRQDPAEKPATRTQKKNPTPIALVETEESPSGEVGLSVKFGSGYEAPMFHVKASDVYTLAALVGYEGPTDVSTRKFLGGLTGWWTTVARAVQTTYKDSRPDPQAAATDDKPASRGSGTRQTSQSRGGGSRPQNRRPVSSDDDDDTDWMYDRETPPECTHGEWRPVTKVGAKGRWFAWGCPGGKDNSCANGLEFVKK